MCRDAICLCGTQNCRGSYLTFSGSRAFMQVPHPLTHRMRLNTAYIRPRSMPCVNLLCTANNLCTVPSEGGKDVKGFMLMRSLVSYLSIYIYIYSSCGPWGAGDDEPPQLPAAAGAAAGGLQLPPHPPGPPPTPGPCSRLNPTPLTCRTFGDVQLPSPTPQDHHRLQVVLKAVNSKPDSPPCRPLKEACSSPLAHQDYDRLQIRVQSCEL